MGRRIHQWMEDVSQALKNGSELPTRPPSPQEKEGEAPTQGEDLGKPNGEKETPEDKEDNPDAPQETSEESPLEAAERGESPFPPSPARDEEERIPHGWGY